MLITLLEFKEAALCSLMTASTWHPPIDQAMMNWGITSKKRIAGFIAQMAYESGKFSRFEENLNYSAQGLATTWPSRYAKNPRARVKEPNELALSLHRKPEKIANLTYANRMGNGPVESGDGWKFIGRGPKQVTGKDNYTACGKALNLDLLTTPTLLLIPHNGAQSAGWYWSSHNCNALIDNDDFRGTALAINGGLIGYEDGNDIGMDDRCEIWDHCKAVFGVA